MSYVLSYFMDHVEPPLIEQIEAFVSDTGMSPVTFGREAMNDPHFVRDLRKGRRLWPETEARVRRFLAATPTPRRARVRG